MVPVRREILQRFVWWGAQTYKFPQLNGTISSLACEESLSNLAILPILRRCWRISPLLVHVKSWKNCGRIYLTWFVSSVWTERKYWTVPYERRVESIFQPVESSSSAIWTQPDHRPTKDLQNTFELLLTVRVRNEKTKSESERELRFTVVF